MNYWSIQDKLQHMNYQDLMMDLIKDNDINERVIYSLIEKHQDYHILLDKALPFLYATGDDRYALCVDFLLDAYDNSSVKSYFNKQWFLFSYFLDTDEFVDMKVYELLDLARAVIKRQIINPYKEITTQKKLANLLEHIRQTQYALHPYEAYKMLYEKEDSPE